MKLVVIGHTLKGREIIALKVTRDARRRADGARPASLYMGTIHAREWIATEVDRRLLHHFVDNYGKNAEITNLVNTRELWFMPVANPDGYQYTFDTERLWRKNLRDVNGDGQITAGDGVDLNRNYDERWNYDDEGSSTESASDTYRGTKPASEPETQAHQGLIDRMNFKFLLTYHSYGPLLLYPYGWQVQTPSFDDPLFVEYTGNDAQPGRRGLRPRRGRRSVHDQRDHRRLRLLEDGRAELDAGAERGLHRMRLRLPGRRGARAGGVREEPAVRHAARTLDARSCQPGGRDDEALLSRDGEPRSREERQPARQLQVQRLVRRSAAGPGDCEAQPGGSVAQVPDQRRRRQDGGDLGGLGGQRYGSARRRLLPPDARKRDRYQPRGPGRGLVRGRGQRGREERAVHLQRQVRDRTPGALVVSAEDYSGISPPYKKQNPLYLQYYLDGLAANGIQADVYDVDANGRRAPSPLGVLGHYDAVVWYTGDDIITRDSGMVPGTAARLANDEMLAMRQYIEEGGRLLFTGKYAGVQYAQAYEFDLERNDPCDPDSAADGCQALSDDFLQYYLGAYLYNEDAGTKANGGLYDVMGVDNPFAGLSWSFGGNSANNQDHSASFIATSGILPKQTYPQFESWASAKFQRPGGPFDPHTGTYYAYSQIADVSYKRLTRTIDLTGQSSGNLSFWMSRDTEPDWDFAFVEAHTVGQDDWTTLPDANGHTSQSTGPNDPDLASCPGGWRALHPWLDHYQTFDGEGACTPTGTTGEWNAASGRSAGWEQWSIDLSQYAGKQVEVSIAYASDWSVQGLGAFVDDTTVSTGATTSFEDGLGGWTVTGPPPGSGPNSNNWTRTTAAGFPEGAAISTPWSIYTGFGIEGISTPAARNAVVGRAVNYLLR